MNRTKFIIFTLILAFCFSAVVAYSEPTEDYDKACKIIQEKWLNSNCAEGITNDVKDPISVLTKMYDKYQDSDNRQKIEYLLGECYYHGENILKLKKDDFAVDFYQKSENKGYLYAKYMLAEMFFENKTTVISEEKAFEYLQQAADGKKKEAMFLLAIMFFENKTTVISEEKAFEYLQQALNVNKKEAMKCLAMLYAKGNNYFQKDKEKSKYWIKKYQHELDSILYKEFAMVDYYASSGNGELADLQVKKIINNIRQFDIHEIKPNIIKGLLGIVVYIPFYNYVYAINDDFYTELEKIDLNKSFLPIISKDSDFKNYYEYIKPILDKTKPNGYNYNGNDYKILFSLADDKKDIWLNTVKKFYKTYQESEQIINNLNSYFDEIGQKIGSEMDLEDYQAIKKVIKEIEKDKREVEKSIQIWLFDVPTNIASCMTAKRISVPINKDLNLKLAKTFSLITSSSLPYTVNNQTRETWAEVCKIIKKSFTENEYKELQNISTKLIPALDLPQDFDMK